MLLHAARKKLEYWKLSETQIKEIESSKIPIRNFDLLADYDGTVTNKLINTGDHIKQGEALLEVTDMSNLWVIFELYERDLNKVSLGQTLTFNTTSGNNLDTRISFIDNKVNPQSRIVEVRGNVRNDNGQLKPEMLIKAQLVTTNSENLTVPKSAVLWTGTRSIIYVKSEGELSFELRKIKLGSSLNNQYEVLEGLVAGEEVVTNGTFTLDAEAQLQGKISMMSFNGKSVNNLKAKITFEEISFSDPKDYLNTTSSVFKSQLEIFFLLTTLD